MFVGICLNNYILIIIPIYYMNSGKNNLFLCFCDLCKENVSKKMCDRVKIAFITWKFPLLGENFILGLTPSLKTSGMPFFVLSRGSSLSVIRAVYLSEKR